MLVYKKNAIKSPEGILCKVLDVNNVDFKNAISGKKSVETLVRRANGGEHIETKNTEGKVEATYIAQKGDAIFINPHNPEDVYVPGDSDGSRWQFDSFTKNGYEIVEGNIKEGKILVKNTDTFKILHEIIDEPTCIKDAWGSGQHQFLFPGATLKQGHDGKVTGIDKSAFDATWEIIPNYKKRTPPKFRR